MLYIYLEPRPGKGLDRVHISRPGSDVRLDLAGRRSAVSWLTEQGCCPGAAAMLHGADYGPVYQIAEPYDPDFVAYVDEPVLSRDRPKTEKGPQHHRKPKTRLAVE